MSYTVSVTKVHNGVDWEALYINGDAVTQSHLDQISVLDHLEPGMEIESTATYEVYIPRSEARYPTTLESMIEHNNFDFNGGENE